jgi:hypothetical protein
MNGFDQRSAVPERLRLPGPLDRGQCGARAWFQLQARGGGLRLAEFARRCREKVIWSAGELIRGSKRLGQWMDWGNDYYTFSDMNIEEPQPAPLLQRQSLQRGPVQDLEVSARVPRPLRLLRGRPRVQHPVLRLVTTASTVIRDRLPHPRRRSLRPGRARSCSAGNGAGRRLRRPSRAVCRKPPAPPALPTAAWINKPQGNLPGTTNP